MTVTARSVYRWTSYLSGAVNHLGTYRFSAYSCTIPLSRSLTTTTTHMRPSDPAEPRALEDLTGGALSAWTLLDEPRRIEKSYKFKDFDTAWDFMNAVSAKCKETNHHPEWSNVYNEVFVRWTTHKPPGGVRKKDRIMATVCDSFADAYGAEVVQTRDMGDLTAAGQTGRDCCTTGSESEKQKVEKEESDEGREGSVAGMGGQPS